jgi:hypothetical protein
MDRVRVSSSNLRSVGYEPERALLEIEFHAGGLYQYRNVPQQAFDALMRAPSKGSYFDAHIKPRYTARKVR